jgi:hypothetical protein
MISITEQQEKILEALEVYRCLTNSQLVTLGVGHIQRVRQATGKLSSYPSEKKPFIYRERHGVSARLGRLEDVFYLSEYGAGILAEIQNRDSEEISFIKNVKDVHSDYWHRKYCVDFHMLLNRAIAKEYADKLEVVTFDHYFDKSGANHTSDPTTGRLRSRTRADFSLKDPSSKKYIIPDVNFILQRIGSPEKKALFCLEMTNGRDTKRILKQITQHKEALSQGVLAEKYGLNTNHKALFLFSETGLLNAVLKRIFEVEGIKSFQKCFYFAFFEDTKKDLFNNWQRAEQPGINYNFVNGTEREANKNGAI